MYTECKHKLTKFLGWQQNYDKTGFYKRETCLICGSTISGGFYSNKAKEREEKELQLKQVNLK